MLSEAQILNWLGQALMPFFRVLGLLAVMPVLGGQLIPPRIRLMLAGSIAYVLMPYVPPIDVTEWLSFEVYLLVIYQVLIGITVGLALTLMMHAFVYGGAMIGMQASLGFATLVDPQSDASVPTLSQLYLMLATLIFLAVDGHLLIISAVAGSFEGLPARPEMWVFSTYRDLAEWGLWIFKAGLQMAIPLVIALLMVNLAFGVMTRAAPQLNIFTIGFPISMMIGMILIWAHLGSVGHVIDEHLDRGFQFVTEWLRGTDGGR